jgi:hypoxanthine phosphoribosyltransferase
MESRGKPPEIEYVSWKKIHLALIELAHRITGEYKPDIIYAVLKGGLIPARILADLLSIEEIGFIGVKMYRGVGIRGAGPELTLPPTINVKDKTVLVVDDVVDTGLTLQLVVDELRRYGAREVKTLALYVKPWSIVYPDYYFEETNKWVVFPWEIVETLRSINLGREHMIEDYILLEAINRKIIHKIPLS